MSEPATIQDSFEVVMASAGTGKTFALTNRMAGLLARGVPVERILAATFTRKAAGEIRERLLSRIARAASDESEAADLSDHAKCDLDAAGWLEVLKRLSRGIHRVRIGTLDSLAQSLARSLAPELGLATPWRQAFEHLEQQLRAEVVERLLGELPSAEAREPIRTLTGSDGNARGDVKLAELLCESGQELRRAGDRAWSCLEDEIGRGPSIDEVKAAAERLRLIPGPVSQKGKPNGHFVNAVDSISACVWESQWGALLAKKLMADCELDSPTYYRIDVPGAWIPELRTILRGAIRAELDALHGRNLAAGSLLKRAVELDDQVRRERRAYSLGDLWRVLAESDLESQQVAYRLDAQYDHVLLDEFQDTSVDQWRVLEPLIDEAVAGGDRPRSVFVVGDVKQALYSWRNAQAELLPYVERRWQQMRRDTLSETYRCAPAIVQAVNGLFGSLTTNAALTDHTAAAELFTGRFELHKSAVKSPSLVRLVDIDAAVEDPESEKEAIELVAERVARVHEQRRDADIAVLVRRQKPIGPIVAALASRGLRAVSDASASPCDHPAVEAVLAALHLAEHPGDGASRFAVATGPLGQSLGLTRWDDRRGAQALSRQLGERLFEHGLARAVEWLAAKALGGANARGRARLSDLVSQAEAYEADAAEWAGVDNFIAFARTSRVQPRGSGFVRVLTLHGAKGLQFDAVFLTDLDQRLAARGPVFLADAQGQEKRDPATAPTRMSLPGSKELREYSPTLKAMHQRWRERAAYEELCLLYVGMTRAKTHLELLVRPSENGLGAVAWNGLDASGPEHEMGQGGWLASTGGASAVRDQVTPPPWAAAESVSKARARSPEPWRVAVVQPSSLGVRQGVADLLALDAPAADLGTEVHRLLETVEWLEDMPQDPMEWVQEHGPRTREAAARIKAAIEAGPLRGVLSRHAILERWSSVLDLSVERERSLAVAVEINGKPSLVRGRIDRLVVGRRDGRVERCLIVDFKSGAINERAGAQVEVYERALAGLLGISAGSCESELVHLGHAGAHLGGDLEL